MKSASQKGPFVILAAVTASAGKLLTDLRAIVSSALVREERLQKIAAAIRQHGGYRWVGLYDVDHNAGIVANIVWSGPSGPEFPKFPVTKGLTSAAIRERRTINVGDVGRDLRYLTALQSTRSEIIVPVFDNSKEKVIGTIDVESEQENAFSDDAQAVLEACAEVIRPLWKG